jgi:hypothetical protein
VAAHSRRSPCHYLHYDSGYRHRGGKSPNLDGPVGPAGDTPRQGGWSRGGVVSGRRIPRRFYLCVSRPTGGPSAR